MNSPEKIETAFSLRFLRTTILYVPDCVRLPIKDSCVDPRLLLRSKRRGSAYIFSSYSCIFPNPQLSCYRRSPYFLQYTLTAVFKITRPARK
jgi:hypothetical protein